MVDDITLKHLQKARVRGAPATIPGAAGLIGSYPYEEIVRRTVRALSLELPRDFTNQAMRDAHAKLAQAAAVQQLRVLESPLLSLHGDPTEDLPHEWQWFALLPVRGRAQADEDAGITVVRIHGGQYLETLTTAGFADLDNVYTYFLGHFLPSRKQQLTRAVLYHRVLDGLDEDHGKPVTLKVFLPIQLSLKLPTRLLTREEM